MGARECVSPVRALYCIPGRKALQFVALSNMRFPICSIGTFGAAIPYNSFLLITIRSPLRCRLCRWRRQVCWNLDSMFYTHFQGNAAAAACSCAGALGQDGCKPDMMARLIHLLITCTPYSLRRCSTAFCCRWVHPACSDLEHICTQI